jgi:alpha-glucosidase (family GH31 glycosyl hydrolase)
MWKYGTKLEEYEIELIKTYFNEYEIFNPNTDIHQDDTDESIMDKCLRAVRECDVLVFSSLSGVVGKGVTQEVDLALEDGKDVYLIQNNYPNKVNSVLWNIIADSNKSNRVYATYDWR